MTPGTLPLHVTLDAPVLPHVSENVVDNEKVAKTINLLCDRKVDARSVYTFARRDGQIGSFIVLELCSGHAQLEEVHHLNITCVGWVSFFIYNK